MKGCVLTDLSQKFRYVHVELKIKLGKNYKPQYPDHDKILEQMHQFVKIASAERR